jgi:SnoaL-like polyketide cyclase
MGAMSELAERTRRFWFELWNERAIDTLREELHPDFMQVDHRALTDSGPTRSDWEELMRSWWEVVPDVAAVEFEQLGEDGSHFVYYVLFSGHDAVSGGTVEVAVYVVNLMRDNRFATGDVFDDRDAALACFAARTATS